jgi:hypothetical protein
MPTASRFIHPDPETAFTSGLRPDFADFVDGRMKVCDPSKGSSCNGRREDGVGIMTRIVTKLGVGTAGCAIAVAASLMSVAPAEAAPVQAPAAPVVFGPADAPLAPVLRGPADLPQGWWWGQSSPTPTPIVWHGWFASWIQQLSFFHCGGYNTYRSI